jgi:hypothetical protein
VEEEEQVAIAGLSFVPPAGSFVDGSVSPACRRTINEEDKGKPMTTDLSLWRMEMEDEASDRVREIRHHLEDGDYEGACDLVDTISVRERQIAGCTGIWPGAAFGSSESDWYRVQAQHGQ